MTDPSTKSSRRHGVELHAGNSSENRDAASARTHGNEGPRPGSKRIDSLLLWTVDAGLAAMILVVPLAMGGRTALGQLALVVLATGVALCWCLRQGLSSDRVWIRSPALWLLSGVLGFLCLQITPLPESWLKGLSPKLYEILPLWAPRSDGIATVGLWNTLSLTPGATRDGFVVVMAFGLLFLVVVQRVRQPGDAERLLKWISLATVIMAVFALVQFFFSNGKFFWCFEHPYATTSDTVKGSFSNRNHFAHFMALGVGPLIWWIYTTWRRALAGDAAVSFGRTHRRPGTRIGLLAIGLAVIVFAGVLSLSRGGTVAMLAAALACLLIVHRIKRIDRRILLALVGAATLLFVCLLVYGYQSVATRLETFSSVDQLDHGHGRRKLWEADLTAMTDFLAAGTGLGSHADVYPKYLPEDEDTLFVEFTHAESGYVQIGLETGLPGLLLLAVTLGLCVWWCVPAFLARGADRISLCFAGVVPSLVASAVHSAADFVWYVPGCMVTPVVLAASACRLRQMADPRREKAAKQGRLSRAGWIATALFLLGIGAMLTHNRMMALRAEPSWHRYLQIARSSAPLEQLTDRQTLQSMEEELSTVVRCQPDHARAHLKLAAVHLKMFDCRPESSVMAMDVRQVRDAAMASQFKSVAAMNAWLSRAFGSQRCHLDAAARHARLALATCPLHGEAYLYLADLSFLDGPCALEKSACIDQALLVRPFDGAVLFAAGQESVLAGDLDRAGQLWRASFQAGSLHQERLLHALAGQIPAALLIDLLQPDLTALSRIVVYYQKHPFGDSLSLVLEQYATASEREAQAKTAQEAVRAWSNAANAYRDLGRHGEAIRCLREAIRCDPFCFDARLLLGSCLLESKDYGEAVTNLQWCVQQKPRDRTAQRNLERAMDGQLRCKAPSTAGDAALATPPAIEPGLRTR